MKAKVQRQLRAAKRRIERRLDKWKLGNCSRPVLTGGNVCFEMAERTRGMSYGGLGAVVLLVRQLGLAEAIDRRLHLLKIHLPYHESDHVLNLAYNALCDGTCLEDIELRRNDEVFLDALGARRIPDPTTAGDFCRRFRTHHIDLLQDVFDETRHKVWAQQSVSFRQGCVNRFDWFAIVCRPVLCGRTADAWKDEPSDSGGFGAGCGAVCRVASPA